jgi:hypothetical protein
MRQIVIDALQAVGLDTPDVEAIVARQLDASMCDRIVILYVAKVARQLRDRRRDTDPRQGWLALPEYENIPSECADESLVQLKARIAQLERRIHDYDYARRAAEGLKRDKQQLRDLKKLEARITPFFAGDPSITVTRAVLLYQESLESPARKQRKEAIQSRWNRHTKSTTSE